MTFLLVNIILAVTICARMANAVVCLRENNDLYLMDHLDNRIPITQPGESYFCTGDSLLLLQKSYQAKEDADGHSEEEYLSNEEDKEGSFKRYWTTGYGFHSHYEHLPAPPPVAEIV